MPTTQELRSRLIEKLKELFQLNQPDLDFGFYRIMHAKARQVTEFLENDLVKIADDAFGEASESRMAQLREAYEAALTSAREFGVENPEETDPVKRAKAAIEAAADTSRSEAEVYDHLYRFFERYYDNGDFISRRYYARETGGKAAPYAVPYNGEEVKLHWANADQYYIKTAEYFANFTFDLLKADEVQKARGGLLEGQEAEPRRVHFQIVEATEGEHGNIKASDQTRRFFIVHKENAAGLNGAGELVCRFEYRPDPQKSGQEGTWRDRRNEEAVHTILKALEAQAGSDSAVAEYLALLRTPAPTEKQPNRPLLAKYINRYTARNTMDYFIHKALGGFLRRELDFYIKNEVMRLDDIESADVPRVEQYLSKIKVLRRIAGRIIEMLAQLEDFQKKLWLKKKFVVETNYCLTLDRVPEAFYPEIAANDAQREEWVRLFAVDEIVGDDDTPGYAEPLTVAFLEANRNLVLDTQFFSEEFRTRLIEGVEDFDEQCDGLLVHSENSQAIGILRNRYEQQVKSIYIDPPYNTDASPIPYKNGYKNSSWTALMYDRLSACRHMLTEDGVLAAAIDDEQQRELSFVLSETFPGRELGTICVRSNPSGRPQPTGYSVSHEYILFSGKTSSSVIGRMPPTSKQEARFSQRDELGSFEWRNLRREGSNSDRSARRYLYYPIFIKENDIRIPSLTWDKTEEEWIVEDEPKPGEQAVYPVNEDGVEKTWRWSHTKVKSSMPEIAVRKDRNGRDYIYYKRRLHKEGVVCVSSWFDAKYSATEHGTASLKALFGDSPPFRYPKSVHAVSDAIHVSGGSRSNCLVFDFFSGSGTTAHAVVNLNREDGGKRKYILVEMEGYLHTALKPRIAKVVYSSDWKDGKPQNRNTGISHCFKYLRLESYEDCLNSLELIDDSVRTQALEQSSQFREDYMLRYMLDVETRGSQSLLNVDAFAEPTAYRLKVKKPGSDEYVWKDVDLLETFNYLIGLRVEHIAAPQTFAAGFKRDPDPELPQDQKTRLVVDGRIRQDADGPWWFRKVEGWAPRDADNPNNGDREKVLVVWRKLTGDLEQDNLMLDEWFQANRISTRDFEFDTIYVNGSNNLPNLKRDDENWKVRLIEEDFHRLMWDVSDP